MRSEIVIILFFGAYVFFCERMLLFDGKYSQKKSKELYFLSVCARISLYVLEVTDRLVSSVVTSNQMDFLG